LFTRKISISSKKQVIIILLIFVIPLISFFVAYNIITVNTLNQRIAQTNKNTLYIYQEEIINELNNIEKFMVDLTAINPDYQQLRNKRSNLDAYLDAYEIRLT
jgi:two-component system sensor histidine kinase YesM